MKSFLLALLLPSLTFAAGIPEPGTVFYGRIVTRTTGSDYFLTQGTLVWTIDSGQPGVAPLRFSAQLASYADGTYSYRLRIPHEAFDAGLGSTVNVVPLGNVNSR